MPLYPNMAPAEYLAIIRRRKWFVIFSFLLIMFGTTVYVVVAPELFRSSTTILLMPQRVPEGYVRSTVTIPIEERLNTIQQQVMSRTRLLKVMEELGLFATERRTKPLEIVVDKMRKRIQIQLVSTDRARQGGNQRGGSDAFTITFIHEKPQMAMLTASRLASFFIDENLKTREQQAVGTSEFLESQLQDTKLQLEAQEERVKQYKLRYMGELPQQLQTNLLALTRLQEQLRSSSDATRSAQDRKVFFEAQIQSLELQLKAIAARSGPTIPGQTDNIAVTVGAFPDPAAALLVELNNKRGQLAALSAKYTDSYPEIQRLKFEIGQIEARIAEARNTRTAAPDNGVTGSAATHVSRGGTPNVPAPGDRERDEIRRLLAQVKGTDAEIRSLHAEQEKLRKTLKDLDERVEKSPRREQEMISLTRDYDNLKRQYDDLLRKKLDADVSQNLEKRQKGEQFQILDPADLPQEPFTPKRLQVAGIGLLFAVLVGVGGAIGMETVNPTLRGTNDFRHFFDLQVLGSIPAISDEAFERKVRLRQTALAGGLVSITLAVAVFLLVYSEKIRTILYGGN